MMGGILANYVGRKCMMLWSVLLYVQFSGLTAREKRVSNTVAHRCTEMTRWMDDAQRRTAPATGDQFRRSLIAA
jgi:hypothetical protein